MRCLIFLVLFVLSLVHVDRFFLKKNNSFCLHYISAPLTPRPEWEASTPFPEKIFDQPFFYLGKGSQTYVFESQDHQYVIKFYKFPSHMRKVDWLKHPFAYHYEDKRLKIKDHNEKRFALSYGSYHLAATELVDESSVVYLHLNPTNNLHKKVKIVDRLGIPYTLDLDPLGFFVQRKAERLISVLDNVMAKADTTRGKHVIDELIRVIVSRCQKGITDLDAMIHNNYGWLDNKAIHIDVGRFIRNEKVKEPAEYKKEVIRITQLLSDYLGKNSPELYEYYQQQVAAL